MENADFVRTTVHVPAAVWKAAKFGALKRDMTLGQYLLLALENQARLESGVAEVLEPEPVAAAAQQTD